MLKCLWATVLTVAAALVAAGCSDDRNRKNQPEPDPTGLKVGTFDQSKFDESVWGE